MGTVTLREVCDMVGVSRRTVQCHEQAGFVVSTGRGKYESIRKRLCDRGYTVYRDDEDGKG